MSCRYNFHWSRWNYCSINGLLRIGFRSFNCTAWRILSKLYQLIFFFFFFRRDRASLNYSISILLVWRKMFKDEFGSYRLCEQRRLRRACASAQSCAVSPEPPLLAHTSNESRGTFRQKARSLAPLNGWAWAVKIARRHKFAWHGPYASPDHRGRHLGKMNDHNSTYVKVWRCTYVELLGL